MVKCKITLLDESDLEFQIGQHENGAKLFEKVCQYLNLAEIGYFGLIYRATGLQEDVWLRHDKPLKKQFEISSSNSNLKFSFAVQYYPSDPSYLKEELTKYQICLQIRDDLLKGKLPCPIPSLTLLSSYWLQSEFGDYKESELPEVKNCLALLETACSVDKNGGFLDKSIKLYESRRGMPAADADTQFLRLTSTLALYGVHRYATVGVKKKDTPDNLVVGIGLLGVMEIVNDKDTNLFRWRNVKNVNYKKSKFYLKLLPSSPKKKSIEKSYHMSSEMTAHAIWRNVVDHHVFFRVSGSDTTSQKGSTSSVPTSPKNIATKRKGSFRFSFKKKKSKTEEDVRQESSRLSRDHPEVFRQSSLRRTASLNSEKSVPLPPQQIQEQPVKPILKDPPSKPLTKDVPSIIIGEMATSANPILGSSCSLLLTETIMEEDESEMSPLSEENHQLSTTLEKAPKISINSEERENFLDEDVSTAPPDVVVEPLEAVKPKPTPNTLLVSGKPTEIEPMWHLVPPLVSQSTREAMVVLLEEEKQLESPAPDAPEGAREVLVILGDGKRKSVDENLETNTPTNVNDVTSGETSHGTKEQSNNETLPEKELPPASKNTLPEKELSPTSNDTSPEKELSPASNDTSPEKELSPARNETSREKELSPVLDDQNNIRNGVVVPKLKIASSDPDNLKPPFKQSGTETEFSEECVSEDDMGNSTNDSEPLSKSQDGTVSNQNPIVTITPVSPEPIQYEPTSLYGEPLSLGKEMELPEEVSINIARNIIIIVPEIEISNIDDQPGTFFDDKNEIQAELPTPTENIEALSSSFYDNSEENEFLSSDPNTEYSTQCLSTETESLDDETDVKELLTSSDATKDPFEKQSSNESVQPDADDSAFTGLNLPYVEADGLTNQQKTEENPITEFPVEIVDGEQDENNDGSDTEFDRKTIGAISAVAVLGDDDVAMDDVTISLPFRLSSRDEFFPNSDSTVEYNSETSSFSEITNDTEELCNPNILDILWAKISGLDDSTNAYERIFNVKRRKNPGRRKNSTKIQSEYYPKSNVSVATQMPSPTPSLSESTEETNKKFIPSWPFNPDSVAGKATLDELDREAITAAMRAHIVLQSNENGDFVDSVLEELTEIDVGESEPNENDETSLPNQLEPEMYVNNVENEAFLPTPPSYDQVTDKQENVNSKIDANLEKRPNYERVPSIPLFAKSVTLHHLGSSASETSSLPRRSSNDSDQSFSKSSNSVKTEALKYPPTINKFKLPTSPRSELLEYDKNVEMTDSPKKTESSKSETTDSDASSPKSMSSSGSSKSSFPRFVHSIFPLRKFSWASSTSSKKRKNKLKMAKKKQANKKLKKAKKNPNSSNGIGSKIETDSKEDVEMKGNAENNQSEKCSGQQNDGNANKKSSITPMQALNDVGYVYDSCTEDSESIASQITDVESLDEIVLSDADEVHCSNHNSSNSQESD